ncbi:MAG TPA: hypothetical protein VN175_09780 [Rhizomicrobium sp.]|nr:hypothetical protein [Rhizomicrobium sp.]
MVYLTEFGEPETNMLRVVVAEAFAVGVAREIPDTGLLGREIVVTPQSRHFELLWESYVAYSVRNESFAEFDKDRPPSKSKFTERSASAYLRFVAETTFANAVVGSVLKGPLRHWEITCADHFLDVVSTVPPTVRMINPS